MQIESDGIPPYKGGEREHTVKRKNKGGCKNFGPFTFRIRENPCPKAVSSVCYSCPIKNRTLKSATQEKLNSNDTAGPIIKTKF